MRPAYVPSTYRAVTVGDTTYWSRDGAAPSTTDGSRAGTSTSRDGAGTSTSYGSRDAAGSVVALVEDSRDRVDALLAMRPQRALHVVVYATNAEACAALDRSLPPSMLLAPLHTPELALIALQSAEADPRNGDPARMTRHVCHELAHVATAERTGSVKRLGDGDRGMRIAPWIDEGFAVCVAIAATDRHDLLPATASDMTDDELAAAFRDLNSPRRSEAFALATLRMWRAVEADGFPAVLARL